MEELKEYLNNKSIIIVGPSNSLKYDNKNGNFIDSFDIVCRIKKNYPIDPNYYKFYGKKTNILISHLKNKNNNYFQNNFNKYDSSIYNSLDYIIHPFPYIEPFNRFYDDFKITYPNIKTKIIMDDNNNNFEYLKKKLKYTPTTFFQSLLFFTKFNVKSINIIGIDFQLNGFIDTYKSNEEKISCLKRTENIHNIYNEYSFFSKYISRYNKKNKIIFIDENLKKHLDKKYTLNEFNILINI